MARKADSPSYTLTGDLLDAMPDGILVASPEGRVDFASQRAAALLGQASPDGVTTRPLAGFVAPGDRGRVEEVLRDVRLAPIEVRVGQLDDAEVWLELNVRPFAEEDDRLVVVLRDATRRKQRERELLADRVDAMERLAAVDTLTELWNRRHFTQVAGADVARCQRYSQMSSLMIFDVDHFKAVNDTGGHAAGDRVLVSAARVLERTLRASDTAYRWGGDEFVVLAPSIGALSAVRLAERVCAAMRSLDLPSPLGHATLSAGVAQLAPSETLEAWIGRADEALYRAKAGGRDRVELSALPTDTPAQRVVQLVWDPELECDDALVNQQHREMFNLANALLDGWTSNAPRGSVEARMTALLDHVVRHFADEEAMLQRVGYPALAQHRAQHRVLVEEALELRHRFQGGTLNVEELVSFVVGRVARDHLMGADVLFFPTVARAAASGRPGP